MPCSLKRSGQPFTAPGLVERFTLDTQYPLVGIAGDQLGLQGKLPPQRVDGIGLDELLDGGVPKVALFGGYQCMGRLLGGDIGTRFMLCANGYCYYFSSVLLVFYGGYRPI